MATCGATRALLLVAEDYEDIRSMMRFYLESLGYGVVEAENGEMAVERAISEHPDLILMDLNMPDLDGYEAARRIHAQPQLKEVPILAVSAYCDNHKRLQALDAGCVECVLKPINLGMIDGLLQKHLTARGIELSH
ncbi:MAG TPA: response regulator [Pyrinomonadaceae bacterium]|jgi:two-component system cell cycle response regulator DivK